MLKEKLCQIGFTENESHVYIELLKVGPQAVSTVAKLCGLNRTTTYSVLKSLRQKGVVSSCMNNNICIFSPNDPNSLVGYVDRKCKTFDYYRESLVSDIPKFRCLLEEYSFSKPMVKYFDGVEGVKEVMFDALTVKDEFKAYLAIHKWLECGLRDFLIEYKDYRIKNKKIPLRAMVPDTPLVRDFFESNYDMSDGMTNILYHPQEAKWDMFGNEMNVYDDKVAIICLEKGGEYGVVIESKEIARMHKTIFNAAWSGVELLSKKM